MECRGGPHVVDQLPALSPPFRFAMVESGLYRGAHPTLMNYRFLKRLRLATIVSLTPEPPVRDLAEFCSHSGIESIHIPSEQFVDAVTLTARDVARVLELLIDARRHPLYIHCLDGSHVTGLVIMCLRKAQRWQISAFQNEFSRFIRGQEIEAEESQFAASFQHPITLPPRLPAWLLAPPPTGTEHTIPESATPGTPLPGSAHTPDTLRRLLLHRGITLLTESGRQVVQRQAYPTQRRSRHHGAISGREGAGESAAEGPAYGPFPGPGARREKEHTSPQSRVARGEAVVRSQRLASDDAALDVRGGRVHLARPSPHLAVVAPAVSDSAGVLRRAGLLAAGGDGGEGDHWRGAPSGDSGPAGDSEVRRSGSNEEGMAIAAAPTASGPAAAPAPWSEASRPPRPPAHAETGRGRTHPPRLAPALQQRLGAAGAGEAAPYTPPAGAAAPKPAGLRRVASERTVHAADGRQRQQYAPATQAEGQALSSPSSLGSEDGWEVGGGRSLEALDIADEPSAGGDLQARGGMAYP